jgi:single-strand DNA-binding protein
MMGRFTADPAIKITPTGKSVLGFTLAVHDRISNKSEFVRFVAWDKTAEFITKHFRKGMQALVTGHYKCRTYDDGKGGKSYFVEIVAESVEFAERKKDDGAEWHVDAQESAAAKERDDFGSSFDDDPEP